MALVGSDSAGSNAEAAGTMVAARQCYYAMSGSPLGHAQTGQHKGAGFMCMANHDTVLALMWRSPVLVYSPAAPGPLIPRIADSQGQKLLKQHANTDMCAHDKFHASTKSLLMCRLHTPGTRRRSPPDMHHRTQPGMRHR
ncbi:hypothetical protein IWW50_002520 [Coemansia erecta]|nr:hypothetical protein IWW50_002520 [Coemansia erecta]